MRSVRRLFSVLAAGTAIFMLASAQAQASWVDPTPEGGRFCGEAKEDVFGLSYFECIYADTRSGGAWVTSELGVYNKGNTPRYITGGTKTVVGGRVQPPTDCGQLKMPSHRYAYCREGGRRHFVPDGSYAYGNGCVRDLSSGQSGCAASSIFRPW